MRLTVDLDSLQLIASAGDRRRVTQLEFKRGDSTPLEVQFVRNGVAEALPDGAVLAFGMKESKKYDSDFAVFFDEFDDPAGGEDETEWLYTGTPNFNTEELDDLLFVDGTSSNDKAFVDLMGELSWAVGDANPVSIRTFTARVHNDVIRGDEGTPLAMPTPDDWLDARAVRYDGEQDLSAPEKAQALANVGVILTEGGEGEDDAGKVPVLGAGGELMVTKQFVIKNAEGITVGTFSGETGVLSITGTDATSGNSGTLGFSGLSGNRTWSLPDRDGTLLPFVEIAGNTTDNAGIAEVAGGALGLVVRNQDTDDWHQVTIRDSGVAAGGAPNGIPQFSISAPL